MAMGMETCLHITQPGVACSVNALPRPWVTSALDRTPSEGEEPRSGLGSMDRWIKS